MANRSSSGSIRQSRIPAIGHVDGAARVQTGREDQNPRLYRLLKEFEAITGVPVLLNTSLNIRGEPLDWHRLSGLARCADRQESVKASH